MSAHLDLEPIADATVRYEAWLARHMTLVPDDLATKHAKMAASPFMFLRATFYRWMQLWPRVCPEFADAKTVLGVGDLHIENFGTWRDAEGRLIWGVNDFDEAYALPYALDLVRLAVSALLAVREGVVHTPEADLCALMLDGYQKGLKQGAKPFVLGEKAGWLRDLALQDLRDPQRFAAKMHALEPAPYSIARKVRQALASTMPERGLKLSLRHRVAGLGSLGRPRVVGVADWYGGLVVREAKPLAPSAAFWAAGRQGSRVLQYDEIVRRAERCPDPYVQMRGRWIVRRLAADTSSIDVERLPKGKERKLFAAMGHETANVHLGSARGAIRRDLAGRPKGWLEDAAQRMLDATLEDWKAWKAATPPAAAAVVEKAA